MIQNNDRIIIENNIVLKRTTKNPLWQYYFKLGQEQFRKSTKTINFEAAKTIALKDFHTIQDRVENNLPVKSMSYSMIVERYQASIKGKSKYKFHSETLQRHFTPYFKGYKDISKIRSSDLEGYKIYRITKYREQNGREALPQTLNKEYAAFNQMLKFAYRNEWIGKDIALIRESERNTQNRRPHFNEEQYKRLIVQSGIILKASKAQIEDKGKDTIDNSKYTTAALLRDIILTLAHTGLRVDEVKTIRWCDIDFKTGAIKLHKAGKTKSCRTLWARSEAIASLKKIKDRRVEYCLKHDKIFCEKETMHRLPNGKVVLSFKKGFRSLLVQCGFEYEQGETRHTLTSLRHTYATYRLKTPMKDNTYIPQDKLAKQMGTSVKMIQKHYGHDTVLDYAHMFR